MVESSSGNLSEHSQALRKDVLKLVFLGLCPGPLYYPGSVYFMYALRHRERGELRRRSGDERKIENERAGR